VRYDLPNVQDEPRPQPARLVLLGARDVTDVVVGSGALLGGSGFGQKPRTSIPGYAFSSLSGKGGGRQTRTVNEILETVFSF
jgi:hypothetical protein